ncbi:MAG TPA: CHASE4 domain-containing protein, partial [Thermoanaerobaculia bacterium]
MTATTFGKTVADQELPQKKSYAVERARFPLVFKLFGLTALLIVIVVGLAIGITIQRANRVANQTVNSSISAAAKLFRELEQQRLQRLRLPTVLIGYDSSFAAYIKNALAGVTEPADPAAPAAGVDPAAAPAPVSDVPPQADLASISDQIEQRRSDIGNALALLLDQDGRVVFRSDRPSTSDTRRTPLEVPLVTKLLDDLSVESNTGILTLDGKLYHAAIAPIGTGTPRTIVGYLINADPLDDAFANSIAQSTNAGVAFVAKGQQATLVARSSNAPSVGMGQMNAVKTILTSGRTLPATRARVD